MPRAGSGCKQITAYGRQADRVRLLHVARVSGVSQSEWLIAKIREAYGELYGDVDPETLTTPEEPCPLSARDP